MRRQVIPGHAVSVALVLVLSGCAAFRPHDAGRLQTAGQALKSASELGSGGGAVFTPMEENLDAVRTTQKKLRRLTDAHEFEAFRGVFHRLDAEKLAVRVVEALESYNGGYTFVLESEAASSRSINEQLDRQALITDILNDSTAQNSSAQSSLDDALKRIIVPAEEIDPVDAFARVAQPTAHREERSRPIARYSPGSRDSDRTLGRPAGQSR